MVEKISAASALTRDPGDTAQSRPEQNPQHLPAPAYQNETDVIVPVRDVVFFTSTFVAQLLGQVLAQGPACSVCHLAAAARAYGGTGGAHLRLLDRRD